jgi:dienelactone hydrolase
VSLFDAGLDGVTFTSQGSKLLGGFYRAAGDTPRPTTILLHGVPGTEKNLDIAYRLRDIGWNCLYFHFRGSWGSEGVYSFAGLTADTRAAVDWAVAQPSVDAARVALVGGSMGGYTALRYGAGDPRVRANVSICPLVDPHTFELNTAMATEFAGMLNGVTGPQLQAEWQRLPSLAASIPDLASRPLLLVTADRDELFPPSHYTDFVAGLRHVKWERAAEGDHAFSTCRPWLVTTVTDWLAGQLGR